MESSKRQCRKELTVLLSEFSMQAAGCHLDLLEGRTSGKNIAFDRIDPFFVFLHSNVVLVFLLSLGRQGSDALLHNN